MKIQQGDQYLLPIVIKYNDDYVVPSNVNDVRVQLGEFLKEYSKSELTYDSENNYWLFALTEEMTQSFKELTPMQIGIKINNDLIYSSTKMINVNKSIIKKEWD